MDWNGQIPKQFDWRKYGIVTDVKNQQKCGSCYAFASVSVLESAYIIAGKADNSLDLSEQQLLNCVGKCKGASLHSLFEYLVYTGIPKEIDLPYTAKVYTTILFSFLKFIFFHFRLKFVKQKPKL